MNTKGSFMGITIFAAIALALFFAVVMADSKTSITGYATLGNIQSVSYSASEFQNAKSESNFASRKTAYELIDKYSSQYDISFNLIRAIIKRESNWQHSTTPNSAGAVGMMQLKKIAEDDLREGACADFCEQMSIDRRDLEENIKGGICYLACQKRRFEVYNSPQIIIAAYKEGPTAVDKKCITCWWCKKGDYEDCTKRLESKTVQYVSDVTRNYEDYSSNSIINSEDASSSSSGSSSESLVVIDAGHGGKDSGALGIVSSYTEKAINLAIAKELKTELESKGIKVLMTRTSDTYPSLKNRVAFANTNNADLFVSIHTNSAKSKPCSAEGAEVWTYKTAQKSKTIAESVVNEMSKNLDMANRGVKTSVDLYVLKKTSMPAILVEVGFICNQNDFQIITNSAKQKQIAESIADGIINSI